MEIETQSEETKQELKAAKESKLEIETQLEETKQELKTTKETKLITEMQLEIAIQGLRDSIAEMRLHLEQSVKAR